MNIVTPSEETEVMRLAQEYGPRSRLIRLSAVSVRRPSPWLSYIFHGLGLGFMLTRPVPSVSPAFQYNRFFNWQPGGHRSVENNNVEYPAFFAFTGTFSTLSMGTMRRVCASHALSDHPSGSEQEIEHMIDTITLYAEC